jgi:hypothetical protein
MQPKYFIEINILIQDSNSCRNQGIAETIFVQLVKMKNTSIDTLSLKNSIFTTQDKTNKTMT